MLGLLGDSLLIYRDIGLCLIHYCITSEPEHPLYPFSYLQNGLLNMVDRNRRIKEAPQKLQNDDGQYEVVIALEERVYDQVRVIRLRLRLELRLRSRLMLMLGLGLGLSFFFIPL